MSLIRRGRMWMLSTAKAATEELESDVEILKKTVANKKIIEKQVRGEVLDEIEQNLLIGKQTAPVTSKLAELTGRVDETNKKLGQPDAADIDPVTGEDTKRGVLGRLDAAKPDPNVIPEIRSAAANLESGIVSAIDEVKKQIETINTNPPPDSIKQMISSMSNLSMAIDSAVKIAEEPGSSLTKSAIYSRYEPIIGKYATTVWQIVESGKLTESEGATNDDLENALLSLVTKIEGIKITAKAKQVTRNTQEVRRKDAEQHVVDGESVLKRFSDKVGNTPDKFKELMKQFGTKSREYGDLKRGVTLYENILKLKEIIAGDEMKGEEQIKGNITRAAKAIENILNSQATPSSSDDENDDDENDDDENDDDDDDGSGKDKGPSASSASESSSSLSTPRKPIGRLTRKGVLANKHRLTPKKRGTGVKKMSLQDILAQCMSK